MGHNYIVIDLDWMARDLALSNLYEREIFALIYRMTSHGNGGVTLFARKIAARLYIPKFTVAKALNSLIDKHLIVKDNDVYRSIVTPPDEEHQPLSVVPNVDTIVQNEPTTVPNMDFLPPVPPIINNKKESASLLNKEGIKDQPPFWEDFMNSYGFQLHDEEEKSTCEQLWYNMSTINRKLILEELTQNAKRPFGAPQYYLRSFKPREPRFFSEEKTSAYFSKGHDIAKVCPAFDWKGNPIYKYVTLSEAQLFELAPLEILHAADYKPAA